MRILVAEDDPGLQAILRLALERVAGHSVSTVGDGHEAVTEAAATTPDLVLLDAMMPGMDGFEACRRLKLDPATRAIPVIFLTARAQTFDARRGLEAGAIGYVTKPFDPMTIHLRIEEVLREAGRS